MKIVRRYITIFFAFAMVTVVSAQELTQTIKGKITDRISGITLKGASIKIENTFHTEGTITDASGMFSMQAQVGRYKVTVSFIGYETLEQELLVIAGREAILNASLALSETVLKEVQVEGSADDDIPGLRSLSIEKTLRIPANFFDPVRVATAYPGVVAANDQGNSIIVRGNSPNGLLWRLNDADIVNPNHLANAGTLSDRPVANGGGVNILSAQMLDRTDFYMGAFPASYGNALSGVIDMRLREGNRTKREYTAQASLIGLDVAAEGPIGKNQRNSFLANYRYSTVGLLAALGVNFGDEAITFQDFSFNTSFEQKNGGTFSLFGLWGNSRNKFKEKDPSEWEEDKDKYNIDYASMMYALGLKYSVPVASGNFSVSMAFSSSDQEREGRISEQVSSLNSYLLMDDYQIARAILSSNIKYQSKISDKSNLEIGMMTNYLKNDLYLYRRIGCLICSAVRDQRMDDEGDGVLFQPYLNWTMTLSHAIDINAGVRYLNYSYNGSSSIEPRVSLNTRLNSASGINVAYGIVSQQQLPQVYFAAGNSDLGFTRSHHVDLDYWQNLRRDLKLKSGVFYQYLFDVPIEQGTTSTFSAVNLIEGFAPDNLINNGTGENYGVDLLVEKNFYGAHYLMIGGSYYESKYVGADGVRRNSRFNGNYTVNATYGKEWLNVSKHRAVGLNTRLLYLGGLRESTVDVPASRASSETVYASNDPFSNKLADYFRVDLRLSFRKDKPGYTRTFAIDIQNLTAQENEAFNYYDLTQGRVITKYQLGIIPVLVYRLDF